MEIEVIKRKALTPPKSMSDFVETFINDVSTRGDISLASFLVSHGFPGRQVSIGSIGTIQRLEAMALNALVSPQATFVVLTGDGLSSQRSYITEVVSEIEAAGFVLRLQFADLTLPGRWPHILAAMARSEIGILGIDARWAVTDPKFWTTLQQFMQTAPVLVYIKGILDYLQPDIALQLIRSMSQDCPLDIVAATPNSIWFAGDAFQGAATRGLLRESGLFPQAHIALSPGSLPPDRPVVVADEQALRQLDQSGSLPRQVIRTTSDGSGGIHYATGWSAAEVDGCWTAGEEAVLRIMFPQQSGVPRTLAITGNSWIPPNIKDQVISIGIGKEPDAWTAMNFLDPEEILTVQMDLKDVSYDPKGLMIRLKVQSPGRPSDFGGADSRMLGFKMRAIAIFT